MKVFVALVMTLATVQASAQIGRPISLEILDKNHCQHTLFSDGSGFDLTNAPMHYQGSMLQRKPVNNRLAYELTHNGRIIMLKDHPGIIRDFIIADDVVWTVGNHGLRKYNMNGGLESVFAYDGWRISNHNLPRSFYHHEKTNSLFIASGRAGLISFDLNREVFTGADTLNNANNNGHISATVAVDGDGSDRIYIAMTGNSEMGFNGILSYDSVWKKIINKAEYNKRKVGVVFPYASIYLRGSKVILNNGGWIHSVDRAEVDRRSKIEPKWVAIPHYQGRTRQFIMMDGDLIFDQDRVMGCGKFLDNSTNELTSRAFQTETSL